jgi:ABC-type methionine transport system ATPase subunit
MNSPSNPSSIPSLETRPQPNPTRIRIQIPKQYRQQPIISELAQRYGVKVNIVAAILGANAEGDGWFDLVLSGSPQEVDSALIYLSELDVRVWQESSTEPDGW